MQKTGPCEHQHFPTYTQKFSVLIGSCEPISRKISFFTDLIQDVKQSSYFSVGYRNFRKVDMNMQREKEKYKKKTIKSVFVCYCFELVFIMEAVYVILICHMCWDTKLGHGQLTLRANRQIWLARSHYLKLLWPQLTTV